MSDSDACEVGEALLFGHRYLARACQDVGPEVIGSIGSFLAGIPAAPSMNISPGLNGESIHAEITS